MERKYVSTKSCLCQLQAGPLHNFASRKIKVCPHCVICKEGTILMKKKPLRAAGRFQKAQDRGQCVVQFKVRKWRGENIFKYLKPPRRLPPTPVQSVGIFCSSHTASCQPPWQLFICPSPAFSQLPSHILCFSYLSHSQHHAHGPPPPRTAQEKQSKE